MKIGNMDHEMLLGKNVTPVSVRDDAGSTGNQAQRRKLGRWPLALLFLAVALPLIGGCVAYIHSTLPIVIGTGDHYGHPAYYGRPSPQYYCYDCHGYTYFDPYYDFCTYYGFRFQWDTHPSVTRYYREHYDVIHRDTPHFAEYKYKPDYRREFQYSRPPDYQTWKKTEGRTFYKGKGSSGQQPPAMKQPQGESKGKSGEGSSGQSQGKSRGKSKGESGGESQGKSKGESQGEPQGKSSGKR